LAARVIGVGFAVPLEALHLFHPNELAVGVPLISLVRVGGEFAIAAMGADGDGRNELALILIAALCSAARLTSASRSTALSPRLGEKMVCPGERSERLLPRSRSERFR